MMMLTDYEIREQLHESSNSIVYRAVRRDASRNSPVILKVLRREYPSPERVAWFKREYEVTRSLDIASVVDAYALEQDADLWLMVLEDFGGESLSRLGVAGQLNIESFLSIAIQLSHTLGQLHQRRIIHKDINPANIVLNPETGEVKLIDFGISTGLSRQQQAFKNPRLLEGTLAYMSPEQTGRMNRPIDYRTDFYSLGVTFYELLTGQLPFAYTPSQSGVLSVSKDWEGGGRLDALSLVHAHIAKEAIPPHEVSAEVPPILSAIVMKLMAKNAEMRYQSAQGLQADLQRCLEQLKQMPVMSQKTGTLRSFELGQDDFSSQLRLSDKLYGREQELAALGAAFERVTHGTTELMLVSGLPGVGKSALVHELHKELTAKRAYFISGKFDQLQRHIPYSAFTEAFNQFCDYLLTEPEAELATWQSKIGEAVGMNGQVLIDIIPALEQIMGSQPSVIEVAPQDAQNRFHLYFQFFIRVITDAKHPLVIFIDDLQWADQASLKLLKLLLTDDQTHHLLLIGAYRDNEVQATHALLQLQNELEKAKTVVNKIQVQNLKQEDVCALLADSLSSPPPSPPQSFDTLRTPLWEGNKDAYQSLAALLYQKTLGNAFFVSQFLHSLYEDGFLSFDSHKRQWQWQMSAIEELSISENVVDLMVSKIGKLPPATQNVLQLAACLGHRFDLESLAIIASQTVIQTSKATSEIAAALQPALGEGLLIPLDEAYKLVVSNITLTLPVRYNFVHDRIQQAAYSLIPEPQKKRLHLQIARLLLARYASYPDGSDKRVEPTPDLEAHIFEIVNQFNAGLPPSMRRAEPVEVTISQSDGVQSLLSEPLEVPLVAHLNLLAGQKAKAATAYQLAWTYLQTGIRLLESESWHRQSRVEQSQGYLWREEYDLALSLYLTGAEAAYLCAKFTESTALVEQILQNARSISDYVKAAEIRIRALSAQGELVAAVEFGLETLKRLGQNVPKNPSLAQILLMVLQTRVTWHGQKPLDLLDSPMMSAREPLLVMHMLSTMIGPVVLVAPKLMAFNAILGVRLSRKYGMSPVSPLYLVTYGATWCAMIGDIERGYQFGQLAMALLKRLPKPQHSIRTRLAFETLIRHWKEDVHETLPALEALIKDALQVGNFEIASFALLVYIGHGFFTGQTLQGWEEKIERFLKPLDSFDYPVLSYVRLILNLVSALRALHIPTRKPLEAGSLALRLLSLFEQSKDEFGILFCYIFEITYGYLLLLPMQTPDHFPLVSQMLARLATQAEKYMIMASNTMGIPVFCMYASLARLADYPYASPLKKLQYRRQISSNQRKMKKWANHAPMNYLHKYYLVEAERCRVFGQAQQAGEYYEQAIDLAKENKYLNEEALANELAGKFYAARGQKKFAQLYLTEAHRAYQRWGARAKVKQLEALYPEFLSTAKGQSLSKRSSSQNTSQMTFLENFDLGSFLKASQAISGQLVRSELLAALMQVVIENAGAQVGHLILPALAPEGRVGEWASGRVGEWVPDSSPEWVIVASSSAGGEGLTAQRYEVVLSETPVSEGGQVSAAIVRYVARKREPVVLSDALHEGHFTEDPDLLRKQAKSILCMPLINQGHLRGILYLENNLATDTFTPDRIEVLNLLSSQAAISLENATLYNTLEEKVAERTAALEQEIKERKRAEEVAQSANQAKSSFLANMSHELRSPLNAILGYARILKRQQPVQKQAEIIEQSGQHLLTLINDLLDIARIESGKIELQPQVVDLVKMLQNCVDMMRIRAQHKGISFRYIASPTLPRNVKVDEKRLRQILINLLSNAIKFTPSMAMAGQKKGQVIFSVFSSQTESSQQDAQTTLLSFQIEDNGIGIPSDKLELIFEPFKQASANDGNGKKSTLASPGTGLGLTISRHLVELMGGTLRVSSQLGAGSTFGFELRLPSVAKAPQHSVERRIIGFKTEAGTMLGERLSVLVVDDRWQSRAILADLLTPVGFSVYEAADGQEGINKALEQRPQVVLTDLVMPILSGIELIRQLRASALKDIVIIAFSASAFREDKEQTLAAGSNAFLPKPINPAQLFATLQEHLPIEWIYEEPAPPLPPPILRHAQDTALGGESSSLSNDYQPSREQITQLLKYAKIGDIQALVRESEQLLAKEPAARAFVTELQQLAKAFKMRQLRQWLSSLLEK